jgi:polar amino acid transport system substrate-binding protein
MSRVRKIVGALAMAALLAGCGSSAVPAAHPAAGLPEPAGVQDPAKVPPGDGSSAAGCVGDSYSPSSSTSGPALRRIKQRGRLVVGVDQNTYLFGYRDPANNALVGFDIDMLRQVAKAIFGDPNKIQFKTITSEQRIPVLQKHQVDLVADVMTINCERWQQVAFSSEYFEAGQRVLVLKNSTATSLSDLGRQKVCAAKGSTSIANIAAADSKPIPVAVDDWTDCLVMLQQGQVAAISTDDAILAGLAAQDPNTKVVGPRFTSEPYGIAANSGDVDLVRFVNSVLAAERSDGTWAALYGKWLKATLGPASPPAARYRS